MLTRNTGVNLYSSMITVLFYMHYQKPSTQDLSCLMSHTKDKAIMAKHLSQGDKWHNQDSNPHSAAQKHQNLSPVLLTAWVRRALVRILPTYDAEASFQTSYSKPLSPG